MTTPLLDELLNARQKRAEALHDQLLEARESIRLHLAPDSPDWLRAAYNGVQAALYNLRGDPFDMHMRAALQASQPARAEGR